MGADLSVQDLTTEENNDMHQDHDHRRHAGGAAGGAAAIAAAAAPPAGEAAGHSQTHHARRSSHQAAEIPTVRAAFPANPILLQVNCRTLLLELGNAEEGTLCPLRQVPDELLQAWVDDGYNVLYLLGVWQTGPAALEKSKREIAAHGLTGQACSSPFAVTAYVLHEDFGEPGELKEFHARCNSKGLALMLDYIPNHVGLDHPWVREHPEFLVRGTAADMTERPACFFEQDGTVFAYGKDPYFDGWDDTVQLDYTNEGLRRAMIHNAVTIAQQCDGLRCDMAMLVESHVFKRTWDKWVGVPTDEFWSEAISIVKHHRPGFAFMAEVYWHMEGRMLELGFDYTYDKDLYDALVEANPQKIQHLLREGTRVAPHMVRFIENHDERRAAATLQSATRVQAAAAIAYAAPGCKFVHWGQEEGRTEKQSMHVKNRPPERPKEEFAAIHRRLLDALQRPALYTGTWSVCGTTPSNDGDSNWVNLVAQCWVAKTEAALVIVNYAGNVSSGHVQVPDLPTVCAKTGKQASGFAKCSLVLDDQLSSDVYVRDAAEMRSPGLWVRLEPWKAHWFRVTIHEVSNT